VIEEARRSHPCIVREGSERSSEAFLGLAAIETPFDVPLPEPPADALERPFERGVLSSLRGEVAAFAAGAGLRPEQAADLALSANEIATNSVRYAGGRGTVRLWRAARGVVCEVSDAGRIDAPLAGRIPPEPGHIGGWGLWLANQLCDLVQVRTFPGASVVRIHVHRG
jgi:anti-sigma regulatory factor (Ser/Thr protein kinase)